MNIPFDMLVVQPVRVVGEQVAGIIPHGFTNDPALFQSLPYIVAEIINTASVAAQANPARTYYYNVLGQNTFMNDEVVTAMSQAVDYIKLVMFQTGASWQQVASQCVEMVVRSRCALWAASNNQLMAFIPPEMRQETINTANNYQQLLNQINTIKQTEAVRGAAPAMGGMIGGGNASGFQYNQAHIGVSPSTSGIFPTNAPVQGNQIVGTVGGKNYDYLAKQKAEQASNSQAFNKPMMKYNAPTPAPTVAPVQVETKVEAPNPPEEKPLTWMPVPDQRYVPVFNNVTQTLIGVVSLNDETNVLEIIYTEKDLTQGEIMNRSQHQIVTDTMILKKVPPMYPSREVAIENSLTAVTDAITTVTGKPLEERGDILNGENVQYLSDVLGTCQNLSCAVFSARYLQKSVMGENYQCSAFRIDVVLQKEFATVGDYRPFIDELAKYKNFAAISTEMRLAFESENTKPELVQLIGKLDTFLTSKINAIFRFKMSLPEFGIDSFMYDIVDAFPAISKEHGEIYQAALLQLQSEFVNNYLNTGTSDEYEDVCLSSSGSQVEAKYKPLVYGPEYMVTITCLDILASELKIGLLPGLPGAIYATVNPVLYNFVSKTIMDAELLKKRSSKGFAAHYMVTADDVVFELHKGLIGDEFYLISKHG